MCAETKNNRSFNNIVSTHDKYQYIYYYIFQIIILHRLFISDLYTSIYVHVFVFTLGVKGQST